MTPGGQVFRPIGNNERSPLTVGFKGLNDLGFVRCW
jgi:hypothetical protein